MKSNTWFYQVIRRNNDANGKVYKLIMVYCPENDYNGFYVESCYEVHTSQTSNLEVDLIKENIKPIEELFIAPREYKALCNKYRDILSYTN